MSNVLYLHGFASSPNSRKAVWFGARLQERGVAFSAPDLEQGDFRNLTISSMLDVVHRAIAGNKVTLIGSSLGGYLAAVYAELHPNSVDRLILMAPAFDFANMWLSQIGPQAALDWKNSGALRMMHYGAGQEAEIGYSLIDDALSYPAEPQPPHPALVFHGLKDNVVLPATARKWCAYAPSNRRLVLYDDGHELGDVLEPMWDETVPFLNLNP
jgi:uncharacterized protein